MNTEDKARSIKKGIIGDWCWGFGGHRILPRKQQVTLEIENLDWESLQLMAAEQCITPYDMILSSIQKAIMEWREA